VREIRTLRSTWRGLETWHGIGRHRRASPRPYLGAARGETPRADSAALRKRRDKISAGTVERGERKRTAAEVSKAD
jgi:hypothetical protein